MSMQKRRPDRAKSPSTSSEDVDAALGLTSEEETPSGAIEKVDSTAIDLPTPAQIAVMDATQLTQWVQKINAADYTQDDESVLSTLAAIYNRQAELTALAKAAGQAITNGNQAMQAAYSELNGSVTTALQGFEQINSVTQVLAGEGASKLAASFRNSADLASRFKSAIGTTAS